jgi:hypothetical protein
MAPTVGDWPSKKVHAGTKAEGPQVINWHPARMSFISKPDFKKERSLWGRTNERPFNPRQPSASVI